MIESTFQLAPGLGPARERRLWSMGLARWDDVDLHGHAVLPAAFEGKLRPAIAQAANALCRRDAAALAMMLPAGELWRLLPSFAGSALCLDIETGDDDVAYQGISAIGLLGRDGPRLLLGGRDLGAFPHVATGYDMLVTFNGLSFDVPILQRAFPDWRPPPIHLDLRHVLGRAGYAGGLKRIEVELGMARPDHVAAVRGLDVVWLWRRGQAGDTEALRRFAEYNLYDVVNLPTLAAMAYNALVEAVGSPLVRDATARLPIPRRGDVLYDVSKILIQLSHLRGS